jgi:hypothetical protein
MMLVPLPSFEALLERYIHQLAMTILITAHPDIREILQEAHDKLCALRKPGPRDEAV